MKQVDREFIAFHLALVFIAIVVFAFLGIWTLIEREFN